MRVKNALTKVPKNGARVSLKVEVGANSGGHDHHDSQRPKGTLTGAACDPPEESCATATTDAEGYASVMFSAPPVSGKHTFTATCISPACTNSDTGKIDVKVEGLVPIPASPYYVLEEPDTVNGGMKPIGATDKHKDNHNVTAIAKQKLITMAFIYNTAVNRGKKLYINDASLPWGGLMDDDGNWVTPHETHRRGDAVDIRAASSAAKPGEIPLALFPEVQKLRGGGINPEIHCYTSTGTLVIARAANPAACNGLNLGRHFHVIFK